MDIQMSVQHGTLLPALIKAVNVSDGPILEFGAGMFSTPFLHAACYETRRELFSLETDQAYYDWIRKLENDYHKVILVKNWDDPALLEFYKSKHWSVVLIDHHPGWRRRHEIKRIFNNTDYVVVHDTQPRSEKVYRYSRIYPLFKYCKVFGREKPLTTVLSNFKDLTNL